MLIGLSGKAQTGKTTVADILAKSLGGRRVSFADALRDEVEEIFHIPKTLQKTIDGKNQTKRIGDRDMTVREILQWWGALRREQDENYWVNKLLRSLDGDEIVIIDDVRYTNEADTLRSAGGYLFRLDPHAAWSGDYVGNDHPSETDLDTYPLFHGRFSPEFGGLTHTADAIERWVMP